MTNKKFKESVFLKTLTLFFLSVNFVVVVVFDAYLGRSNTLINFTESGLYFSFTLFSSCRFYPHGLCYTVIRNIWSYVNFWR